jgi:hypothetical protein
MPAASLDVRYDGDHALVQIVVNGEPSTKLRAGKSSLISFARLLLDAETADVDGDVRLSLEGSTPAAPVREELTEAVLAIITKEPTTRTEVARQLGRDKKDATVRRIFAELANDGLAVQSPDYKWSVQA